MRTPHTVLGFVMVSSLGLAPSSSADSSSPATLVNPGFEFDGTGVASPTGWTTSGTVNASNTEPGGHSGSYRLSHWNVNAYSVDTIQTVSNLANGWYTLSAWVRRSTGSNNSYIALTCGRDSERTFVPVALPSQWLQIVASVRSDSPTCTIDLHTDGDAGEWANFDDIALTPGVATLSVPGADVSSLNKSVAKGGVYHDGSTFNKPLDAGSPLPALPGFLGALQQDVEIITALGALKQRGDEYIRLRVWVNPADGYHNKQEVLRMSRFAKALNLKVLVDFHYSDTWADPVLLSAWSSRRPMGLRAFALRRPPFRIHTRSKRSRFMTFVHAATKSSTNLPCASELP